MLYSQGHFQSSHGYAEEEEDTLLLIDDYVAELKNGDVLKLS